MDRVESGNLTSKSLHDEGCHRVAHMSSICQAQMLLMLSALTSFRNHGDSPVDNLFKVSAVLTEACHSAIIPT